MKVRIGAMYCGLLFLFLTAIIGCGSKSESDKPAVPLNGDAVQANNTSSTPVIEEAKLVHEMDPAKHDLSIGRLRGSSGGKPFTLEALVEGENLVFRTVKTDPPSMLREIRLKLGSLSDPHLLESRKVTIRQETPVGPQVPEILLRSGEDTFMLFPNGYALSLELGTRQDWRLPGKIYLCLPDKEQTIVAGAFFAAFPRQPNEPPGPEDLPYIKGSVKVIGAPPTANLRVGYIADERPDVFHLGSVDLPLGATSWIRNENERPHVTTLLVGDGKNVLSQYEHSRLRTGRYLVFAALEPTGPIAWKWVAVVPGQTHTIDLTIDATQVGGVEIGVPSEAVSTVLMAPADTVGYHPLESRIFTACSWQLGLEQPIIKRKSVFKNLAPGRYEVRSAGHTRIVEIVAGKTIELEFDKTFTFPGPVEIAPEPRQKM